MPWRGGSCGAGVSAAAALIRAGLSRRLSPSPPRRPLRMAGLAPGRPEARNGLADLLPLRRGAFLAKQEARPPPSSARAAAQGCGPAVPSPEDRHRGRMGRPEQQSGDTTMAQIGTFTRGDDGTFAGTIRTLNINVKATIRPSTGTTSGAPTTGSPPTASNSVRAGARRPRTRAPNTSQSNSTTPPSRPRSTRAWFRATTVSTSSSGPADRHAAPRDSAVTRPYIVDVPHSHHCTQFR